MYKIKLGYKYSHSSAPLFPREPPKDIRDPIQDLYDPDIYVSKKVFYRMQKKPKWLEALRTLKSNPFKASKMEEADILRNLF